MSDQFNNDVLCGAIFENGEYAPIYCNKVTGNFLRIASMQQFLKPQ